MLGGTVTSVSGDAIEHRDHLLDEQRITLGGREDALAQPDLDGARELAEEELARVAAERFEQNGCGVQLPSGPAGPAVEQLRARHAQQQDRCVARPVRDVLDQVEEGVFRPVQVVPHDDERRSRAASSNRRLTANAISSFEATPSEHDAERPCDARIELALLRTQLLHRLDERPVRDALAVRRGTGRGTTVASTPRRNSATRRDLPTPATPSSVKSWHARSRRPPRTPHPGGAARARVLRRAHRTSAASRRGRGPRRDETRRPAATCP